MIVQYIVHPGTQTVLALEECYYLETEEGVEVAATEEECNLYGLAMDHICAVYDATADFMDNLGKVW